MITQILGFARAIVRAAFRFQPGRKLRGEFPGGASGERGVSLARGFGVALANTAAGEAIRQALVGIANVFDATSAEEWIQITPPLGDYPHARGIQRIDRQAVEAMANNFNSLRERMARRFGGVPFYLGHPDHPEAAIANEFPDKKAYGWVMEVDARADGLFGKVKWSGPGKELLANAHYKYFSPFWFSDTIGVKDGKKVYRPFILGSVGLTNQPNLPVNPLANSSPEGPQEREGKDGKDLNDLEDLEDGKFMERNAMLSALGLANTATDAEITTRLAACVAAYTSLANVQTELGTARTALSNEQTAKTGIESRLTAMENDRNAHRKARSEMLVDAAISDGRVPLANKAQWVSELEADFAAKCEALAKTPKAAKTTPDPKASGDRRGTEGLANVRDRANQVEQFMSEKLGKGLSYDAAWTALQREKPELIAAMTKPESKS